MRFSFLLVAALSVAGCGQKPGPIEITPNATLAPPTVKATPPAGPFNGTLTITFEADREATIYASTNGLDPRDNSEGRLSGPSPFTLEISATTTVKYFASADGKDGDLSEGTWVRAGGPKGTISGVVVVGTFAVGKEVGLFRNTNLERLGTPTEPKEIPFSYTGLTTGNHRLVAISDRNGDGQLAPFIDYQSPTTTVQLDLNDPFKASAENVRIYLGASSSGLGTLRGTITLPRPPPLQNLQISLLDPSVLSGAGLDPMVLLQQLQNGYRILTNNTQTDYPYVLTELQPGTVIPVPSLIGFGGGGVAINLIANPFQPVTILADQETVANFAFGPVSVSGTVIVGTTTTPVGIGVVAARAASMTDGVQAILMPVLFTQDPTTGTARAAYGGTAIRANSTLAIRVFTGMTAITEALTWVVNPFGSIPPHTTVTVGTMDVTQDIVVP